MNIRRFMAFAAAFAVTLSASSAPFGSGTFFRADAADDGITLYISPDGSDTNDGSADSPFATLTAAPISPFISVAATTESPSLLCLIPVTQPQTAIISPTRLTEMKSPLSTALKRSQAGKSSTTSFILLLSTVTTSSVTST